MQVLQCGVHTCTSAHRWTNCSNCPPDLLKLQVSANNEEHTKAHCGQEKHASSDRVLRALLISAAHDFSARRELQK